MSCRRGFGLWRGSRPTVSRWLLASGTSVFVCLLAAFGATAGASGAGVPDPCTLVPNATIASVFGRATPPSASLAATSNTSSCSYGSKSVLLTIEVGFTALTNPELALRRTKVAGLPHGLYSTYAHTTQTQIVFYEGSAASGLYVVLRSYSKTSEGKLVKAAKAVNAALLG
jgi:hypothetical protein